MTRIVSWNDPVSVEEIMREVRSNRIFIGDTDTVPGLFASLCQEGFEGLNAIKGRTNKPYLILISDKQRSFLFSADGFRPVVAQLMDACWPGPLTLILTARRDIPPYLMGVEGTVALRVPQREPLRHLLSHVDGLFSTSANYAGRPTPQMIQDVDLRLLKSVSLIIEDDYAYDTPLKPSTIVDCTGPTPRIVREGAYSRAMLEQWGVV